MATILEEKFVKKHIKGNNVFEFGCAPGKFTEEIAKDYNVTAIDLYAAEQREGYKFIQGDIVETEIPFEFDSVVCLSSFEHCGIESLNYTSGYKENLTYDTSIASRLVSLVKPRGRLIITAPFGSTDVFFVDKYGNNGTASEVKEPVWGFRTYRLKDITKMFSRLTLKIVNTYGFVNGNYFEEASWRPVAIDSYRLYNNKHRGLICCVLEKEIF